MPTANVDGLKIHYLTAGDGPAILLLHGYAETSSMWRPLIPRLEGQFRVIAPDLPGIGESDVPTDGLDLTSAARRIHSLMAGLDIRTSIVVGHDIGLMVAYAYAALFPAETQKLVLMDAFIPGVDGWEAIHNHPGLWHFRFHGSTPEALVSGRERIYFDYYWNEFAADRTRSISEADRQAYTAAYARPGRMRSAWSYFDSFSRAADRVRATRQDQAGDARAHDRRGQGQRPCPRRAGKADRRECERSGAREYGPLADGREHDRNDRRPPAFLLNRLVPISSNG